MEQLKEQLKKHWMWAAGGSVAAIAGVAFLGFAVTEDRDASLVKNYGIDPAQDCYSADVKSAYHRANSAQVAIDEVQGLAGHLGPVGQDILATEFSSQNPICFAPRDKMKADIENGGFLQRYRVIADNKSPSWLLSQYTSARINALESRMTDATNQYIVRDALLWERLRHAVPAAYDIYAHFILAVGEAGPGESFTSSQLWRDIAARPGAEAFAAAMAAGNTPQRAFVAALQSYLQSPVAVNQGDVDFLGWYSRQVGEQETNVKVDVTCDTGGWNDYTIWTALPEKVSRGDVLTSSVKYDIDSECSRIMDTQESDLNAYKIEVSDAISDLEDDIRAAESDLANLGGSEEDQEAAESLEGDLAGMKSDLDTLEGNLANAAMEDVDIDWTVTVYHDPASSVHSRALDPANIVRYVDSVFGQSGFLNLQQAREIVSNPAYTRLYSGAAQDLYAFSQENAATFAKGNYDPALPSAGIGLRF